MLAATSIAAEISANTSVVALLGLVPKCAVPCVMNELFETGGCPMTTAGALGQCACKDVVIQSRLSACVQKSCNFQDQVNITGFAADICEGYPPASRVGELRTIAIATIVLAIPVLLLRLYSRWLKNGRLWSDDAFAIIAAIFLISVSAIILRMSQMGFGMHYWNVPAENGVALLKMFYVCQMLYILVQIFSKVAILVLYSRLFPDFIHYFQWTVRCMIAFMFIHGAVFFFLVTFQCLPINSIWDKTIVGKCLPVSVVIGFLGAALSIVEDFIILLLPIRELWKLQMNTKKKIGLVLLLSIGSFASVTSIVRLKYVLKYANTYDATWDNVDVIKWSLIEILSACICGNLMPLRPLIDRLMPSVRSAFSWYSRGSRKSSDKDNSSAQIGQFSWLNPLRKRTPKPKLISTLNFTNVNLKSGWDWKKSNQSEFGDWKQSNSSELASPTSPLPAYHEKSFESYECQIDERSGRPVSEVPLGMIKKTSTTTHNTTQMTNSTIDSKSDGKTMDSSQRAMSDSEGRTSRGSESGLVPPARNRENRHSGPWSRALNVLYRR
ncbi:hypothetical protein ACN47E_007279 [Coniothyrium glycines]